MKNNNYDLTIEAWAFETPNRNGTFTTGIIVGYKKPFQNGVKLNLRPLYSIPKEFSLWQPIETAPKDGTKVALLCENGKIDFGSWYEWSNHFDKKKNGIADDITGEYSTQYGEGTYTHWMHIKK